MKIVGKCAHCKDPIFDFQQKEKYGKLLYHKSCYPLATQSARY